MRIKIEDTENAKENLLLCRQLGHTKLGRMAVIAKIIFPKSDDPYNGFRHRKGITNAELESVKAHFLREYPEDQEVKNICQKSFARYR